MKLNDTAMKPSTSGYLKVERKGADGQWLTEWDEKNLVVDNAANILRDLVFGDANRHITKILFGDMNLRDTDDTKNVAAPDHADTALINKLYEKAVTKTKITYNGAPAIQYVVTLEESEFNGTGGAQMITEYSLSTADLSIFTRKTRAAVYKDSESSLRFTWTLVFN